MDEGSNCYVCGGLAPFIIYVTGEDEKPHEEWACELHARGHWRAAIVEPQSTRHPPVLDAW